MLNLEVEIRERLLVVEHQTRLSPFSETVVARRFAPEVDSADFVYACLTFCLGSLTRTFACRSSGTSAMHSIVLLSIIVLNTTSLSMSRISSIVVSDFDGIFRERVPSRLKLVVMMSGRILFSRINLSSVWRSLMLPTRNVPRIPPMCSSRLSPTASFLS